MNFSWKIIDSTSPLCDEFLKKSNSHFSKLNPINQSDYLHIAGIVDNKIVGGISLKESCDLSLDSELNKHWEVKNKMSGTRMLRLWVEGPQKRNVVCELFKGVMGATRASTFLYGVLSLPLAYAQEQQLMFNQHKGILIPKTPLDSCSWNLTESPTSEGRKLIRTYMGVGAEFLGLPSGNSSDKSVRVAMGMAKEQVHQFLGNHV